MIDKRPLPVSGSMKVKRFAIREAIEKGSPDFFNAEAPQKKSTVSFEGYDEKTVADTLKKVIGVFSKILSLPTFKIDADANWINDLGGDSMSYIEMCQTMNKTFKVDIPQELWGKLGTANDFTKEILDLMGPKAKKGTQNPEGDKKTKRK